MILIWMIAILLAAGVIAWAAGRRNTSWPRWIVLIALGADLALAIGTWMVAPRATSPQAWIAEWEVPWVPQLGISFHLAVDGLSLVLLLLTYFLGIIAVLSSWNEVRQWSGFFHLNLAWVLAGITGVFVSMDLFLFFFCWELMLIPMYFLIAIWGHERRAHASIKFFLFTQLSGLLMLVSIVALGYLHYRQNGVLSFDYEALRSTALGPGAAMWILLGFFAAFAVKLPMIPVHTWLPDAHTEAPTAGSVILAGLLLKTGAYGLLRFAVPMFPEASRQLAPFAIALGVAGILYGAFLAFAQTDLKRMVAYTSISHLGFVLVGVFAWSGLALQGVLLQMVCHGLSTGALFVVAGALQERMHTRDLARMGGLWSAMPKFGALGMFFAMASLGLPGLGNFVAEILILFGSFPLHPVATVVASVGMVAATIYALRLMQRVFLGPKAASLTLPDLSLREAAALAPMAGLLVWLGLYPQPILNLFAPVLDRWPQLAAAAVELAGRSL